MKRSGSAKSTSAISRMITNYGHRVAPSSATPSAAGSPTPTADYASANASVEATPRTSLDGHYEPVRFKLNSGPSGPSALSMSPDRDRVVVVGREILKILSVNDYQVKDVINLRSGTNVTANQSSNDVKWGNSYSRNKIATAAMNGNIVIWDLTKQGKKTELVIHVHERAVNRICFLPVNGIQLLSASQDKTVKLWDLRNSKPLCHTFEGKYSVRDVQFNPLYSHEFAAAFDNGAIQKWDIRTKALLNERELVAHINGPCLTVDWHGDGRTLASGGRDKTIKVWDTENWRTLYIIRTMAAVSRIQWRPDYDNELASCSLQTDYQIHIWDVRRPNIAKYSVEGYDIPTGFTFFDASTIFSVSKDRYFIRSDVRGAYRSIDFLSKSGVGWNVFGDVAFTAADPAPLPMQRDRKPVYPFVDDKAVPGLVVPLQNRRKTEPVSQYQPPQTCGVVQFPLFDFQAFTYLAQNYIISSDDVREACEHNSRAAWDVQKHRTSQTWKIIQLLYTEPLEDTASEPAESATADRSREATPTDIITAAENTSKTENVDMWAEIQRSSPYYSVESSDDESEDIGPTHRGRRRHTHRRGPSSMTTSTTERDGSDAGDSSQHGETRSVASTVIGLAGRGPENGNANGDGNEQEEVEEGRPVDRPEWQHQAMVENLLKYYTEQGDVQMCVTLSIVLEKYFVLEDEQLEAWFDAYLDLLRRFKLWSVATVVVNACRVPRVREENQISTVINVTCNNCFKWDQQGSWACDKCHKLLNPCSICHQTVKGQYVWCQGCSHGGHLQHMWDWFQHNSECPTGCGHKCSPRDCVGGADVSPPTSASPTSQPAALPGRHHVHAQ